MLITNRIDIIQGDITLLCIDAIVNAANSTLLGGGGVDGAIHNAAGPELMAECMKLDGCETGEAKITKGYILRAKHVIHTVGPVWKGGTSGEPQKLASCYRNSLKLAAENNVEYIAFPSISTGAYRYPIDNACRIAIWEAVDFLKINDSIKKIIFVCFSFADFDVYEEASKELMR